MIITESTQDIKSIIKLMIKNNVNCIGNQNQTSFFYYFTSFSRLSMNFNRSESFEVVPANVKCSLKKI